VYPFLRDLVADDALYVRRFFVRLMTVHAWRVCVGVGWERYSHGVLCLVAAQAFALLGYELMFRSQELVTYYAVNIHILHRLIIFLSMALGTDLLSRPEDMQPEAVAVDAIRGLVPIDNVYLVTRCAQDL